MFSAFNWQQMTSAFIVLFAVIDIIALTLCPGIGHIGAKRLIDAIGSAVDVFGYRKELPERLLGVNSSIITALDCPAAFLRAEREMEFVEKNRLTCLTLRDEAYPSRLRECEDAPIVLFFKGNTDFNQRDIISHQHGGNKIIRIAEETRKDA